jgi:uncharacterized repeat protein (TIGR01451 family)
VLKMKKLFILTLVALAVMIGGRELLAQTAAGTGIANTAIVTADNVSISSSDAAPTTNVQVILGAHYTVIPADVPAASGSTILLVFTVQNDGNANDGWTSAVVGDQGNAAAVWTTTELDTRADDGNIAMGGTVSFTLQVDVDAGATNNAYREYRVEATSINSGIREGRYQGDNGTWYGGDLGIDWANVQQNDGILRHAYSPVAAATTNEWIRITIQGPVLNVVKEIYSITLGGAVTELIPGAKIIYVIKVTNVGAGPANDVIIRDDYDDANTAIVAGSISNNGAAGFAGYEAAGVVYGTNSQVGALPTNTGSNFVHLYFSVTVD